MLSVCLWYWAWPLPKSPTKLLSVYDVNNSSRRWRDVSVANSAEFPVLKVYQLTTISLQLQEDPTHYPGLFRHVHSYAHSYTQNTSTYTQWHTHTHRGLKRKQTIKNNSVVKSLPQKANQYQKPILNPKPETFQRTISKISRMNVSD